MRRDITTDRSWVHAAVPIAMAGPDRDGDGEEVSRAHVLLTSRAWQEPLFCDRQAPPAVAVSASARVLSLAKVELVPLLTPW
jgi:hypothetical protein